MIRLAFAFLLSLCVSAQAQLSGGDPGDNGIGGDIARHYGPCRDDGAGSYISARQHHGAVPDPDVMADIDMMAAAPREELGIVAFAREI